jgi:HEAT repeat protein
MRRSLALAALALSLAPGAASAQGRLGVATTRPPERRVVESTALRAQVGIPAALRLLGSDDFATKLRGIERLASIGTTDAIDALVDAMDQSSVQMRDPRARLVAVRALASEAKRDNVRGLLMREVNDTTGVSPLAGVLRHTAALAIARWGEEKGHGALIASVVQGGLSAEAAMHALRIYPPASLEAAIDGRSSKPEPSKDKDKEDRPKSEARRRLTPQLAAFLGDLGDMRGLERLRPALAEGDVNAKMIAAIALAKLGDESALPTAREWLTKSEPRSRRAAAEVLTYLDAPEAPAAVAALFESEATREDGLRLALLAPTPALAAPLAKIIPDLPEESRGRAIAALGRARAAEQIAPLLEKPETALAAAFALATMPGEAARIALEKALAGEAGKQGDRRRLLLRAGVVRALVLDDAPAGLRDGLRALYREKSPADRAAGAFGLVALGSLSLSDAIEAACPPSRDHKDAPPTCDAALLGAAARGALALPDGARSLEPLFPLLQRAGAGAADSVTVALGAALLAHPEGGDLPTSTLASWAEAGGPLAPLAARALATRDDEALRPRLKRLLEGSDPVVRAHVALGLGRDPEPSSVSLLTRAYRFEDDAGVRRAIVRALSRRTEVQRVATLEIARDIDPDEETRSLARTALSGRVLDPGLAAARGIEPRRSVAWITVRPNDAKPKDAPLSIARLVRADGLAIPAVADPDGGLLVPGLPAGTASLQLGRY